MPKFVLMVIAAVLVFSSSAQAGYYRGDCKPYCFIKKVRMYDSSGHVVIKKIRVCE